MKSKSVKIIDSYKIVKIVIIQLESKLVKKSLTVFNRKFPIVYIMAKVNVASEVCMCH